MMIGIKKTTVLAVMLLLTASGCARLAPQEAFDDVAYDVGERINKRIQWDAGTREDLEARSTVKGMLSRQLMPSSAVQIALLNNRDLQAAYADVGIAQANLVQAGLLKNPVADGAVTWFADAGGTPNLAFGVAWSFIDLLKRPRRKAVARSALEEAKLGVARRVVVHAANTHAAFVDYVAAMQEVDLFKKIIESARATVNAAAALRKAGNITALQFEQNQSFLTNAKLELAQVEVRADEAREKLNVLMGLTGSQTFWSAPHKLPDLPRSKVDTRNAERRALRTSLEIAMATQKLTTLGRRFRQVRRDSLLRDVESGAEFEREIEVEKNEDTGEKEKSRREAWGPVFEVEIPIFDRGQARKAGVLLQIQQAEDSLWALAVKVRSAARLSRVRVLTASKTVNYYKKAVLPQRQRILLGTQRDYNAMQESIFQLISARRQQILAGRQSIQAQRAYWIAYVRFQQLMSGTLPDGADTGSIEMASSAASGGGEGGH
jgi:cobalt-zinc-cadmium efflux system outer membrane protein